LNTEIQPGGRWKPNYCLARHRVAIIIPYRDRLNHLRILLSYLHEILQRQELDYQIFVSEQVFRYLKKEVISYKF
jgi:beta-1,4-galactosyltransferase 1